MGYYDYLNGLSEQNEAVVVDAHALFDSSAIGTQLNPTHKS
jgi:hypothetical protein